MSVETETISIAGKLTVGSMGLGKQVLQEAVKGKKTAVPIAEIMCLVRTFTERPSTLNAANMDTKFIGQFEGSNLLTGEVVRSGSAYFPGPATDYLKGALSSSDGVEMAALKFTITVKEDKDPRSACGYKFGVEATMQKAVALDPFQALRLPAGKKK